jgi:antitoxin MazE
LPKPLIEQAGLTEEVELRVQEGAIVIARASSPRFGWADAARHARQRQEDRLLEAPTPTRFDDEEWEW